ncbi:MAG: response regulator [Pleurocapsa sp.]
MKILLVEDDELIAQTLENILQNCHYVVDRAAEGQMGWEFVEAYDYDLILLDIILPKLNGIEFCKKLRDVGNQTPVLLLTSQNSSNKKVIGLDAGADDYVVKPFEISELLARIRVLLRRRNSLSSPILKWEKLQLNSSTHEVTYNEKILTLTPKEYRLLELFLESGDRVLTRDNILDRLWDVEHTPNDNTVCAHIKDLRRKLKQAGANADWIETVYGVGYRLKPVNRLPEKKQEKPARNSQSKKEKLLQKQTKEALTNVWHKFEEMHRNRLKILEQTAIAWQQQTLEEQLLQQAQYTAHKLAGGLGVFGFTQASELAMEMEELLTIQSTSERERARLFSRLLVTLKDSLQPNLKSDLISKKQHIPIILAVDNQPELVEKIITEITTVNMIFKLINKPEAIKQTLVKTEIDVIIWTFSLNDCITKILNNFSRIIGEQLPLPVILFTDTNNQSDRLKLACLNSGILLQPASLNINTIKAIVKTLQQARNKIAKVLVVDDDPQILAAIQNLLDLSNLELTLLDNPLDFWQTITELEPDLLILDVAMPHFTGIELCQLLRSDHRWQDLPILFLTVHNNLNTLQQILSVGGNDCISKTQTQLELIPKIFNHLHRKQILITNN